MGTSGPQAVKRATKSFRRTTWPVGTRTKLVMADLAWQIQRRTGWRLAPPDMRINLQHTRIQLTRKGHPIDYLTFAEIFLDSVYDAPVEGRGVIDIGAHRGYFGAYAIEHGAARVWSYEPESSNLASLRAAARFVDPAGERWRVRGDAVGSHEGTATLQVSSESWAHSLHEPVSGEVVGVQKVRVRAVGDVLDEAMASRLPLVIKVNVEGAAGELLMAMNLHNEAIKSVMFDYEPGTKEPIDQVLAHLGAGGLNRVARAGRNYLVSRS